MEFHEYDDFKGRISNAPETRLDSDLVYPSGRRVQYSIPPPYDVFFQIIAGAAGVLTVAKIISDYLRRSPRRSLRLIFGRRSIEVQGDYTDRELTLVLRTFATEAGEKETGVLTKKTFQKMMQHKEELEKHLAEYRALITVFEDESKGPLNQEQRKKLAYYERRMNGIRNELLAVQDFIRRISRRRKV